MLSEQLKSNYLASLQSSDLFKAQIQLEDELFSSYASKLITLPLEDAKLGLEYARVRGALEALKQLQSARARLIESAVENNR